ncbi:MAG: hydantoinase B/oxoprolinase family protein [Sphingomonadales bacterium]|nr:hydantoinase B/oxoprolinase family protein [Sphingomonadales bacterium]MBD3774367.1 hydantoinase B/oxoprolinase family protein [Paracoccaceae bacterium]
MDAGWHFWIDRGGTFTDVVARDPAGAMHTAKLLSENPAQYDDAALEAIRRLSGADAGELPPADIRIGTTIATNALLERKGEPVLLAITRGFRDTLAIGTQERPDIFALDIRKPAPLPAAVLEVDERIGADGTVYRALDRAAALAGLREAYAQGFRAVAIALMHGYRFTAHEAALAELAREAGFAEVAVSHRVSPLARLVGRADTTCVDAYLSPVLEAYTARLAAGLGAGNEPLFMQSNGGLAARSAFRGKDAILSGPAGGIVGMAETSRQAGFERVIGFDMGGTSTDVSLFAGQYERDSENRVAGVRIRAPMMRIHTVAAGGGSICRFDGARFLVGPESAGAQPGPACYRAGGPLTVTDCNLLLGKLQPDHFPHVFGPDGDQPLDSAAAQARMDELRAEVAAATGRAMGTEEVAEGLVAIAVADMANAIRAVSVAKGHDTAQFALACFGGAGGQHACLVADALGIGTVLVHPLSGVLSAYGMGLADWRELREMTLGVPLETCRQPLDDAMDRVGGDAIIALVDQGIHPAAIRLEAQVHIRSKAGESTIAVPLGEVGAMRAAYAAEFRRQFGYDADAALVAESLRVEAVAESGFEQALPFAGAAQAGEPARIARAWLAGAWHDALVWPRDTLAQGQQVAGPALIIDPVASVVVEPGWQARIDGQGMLVLTRSTALARAAIGTGMDPVRLEIFGGLFMAIAEEMGAALQHSAASVNIRERLDFSCAIFDAGGNLVANAPHMPVHLGSMGDSVRAVVSAHGDAMRAGDAYALNAPYRGGTHLPDITVVGPVYLPGGDKPAYFTAARGHHADIGGIAPGSMPSNSRSIEEEGVVLDALLVRREGQLLEAPLRNALAGGRWPARNIDQNIADLAAQIAACKRGETRLLGLVADYGADVVSAYMEHLQDYSAQAVARLLAQGRDGQHRIESDNGAAIAVAVRFDRERGRAVIDFAGTSAQLPDNFNAPEPVVRAACLYVIRTLIDTDVPMNDGFLRPVEIRIPPGCMLSPRYPAAVVAGNVETSQLITDALFGAFGALAASQGTMNNFTFGDAIRQYYETIAGGAGAGDGFAGASAVQTHMTNSRLTDPEILEARYPVLLEEFSIRHGSGGAGRWRGGDGAVRRLRFLEPMRANILANRRATAPFGLAGGGAGARGASCVERADGRVERLGATASVEMQPGDVFVIETPGGGGFGEP